jgi:DNA-binding CsgD family transcriptional regulator/DNA-binding winged helix-turn-helix (wHTH) protein
VPELLIDQNRRCAWLAGQEIHLTPQEYRLIHRLAQQVGQVVTKAELLGVLNLTNGDGLGGHAGVDPLALDLVVFRLRRKLNDDAHHPTYLETRRGFGYILHHARILEQSVERNATAAAQSSTPIAESSNLNWMAGPWSTLTRREWRIFLLLGDEATTGLTNKALAQQLQIGEGTLKKHLQHIYRKLGVGNRSGAALLALQARVQFGVHESNS